MKVSRRLATVAIALAISAAPALASADDSGPAPVQSGVAGGSKSVIWVDPVEQTSQRTSTAAMFVGIGLAVVGTVQLPIGVSMLTSSSVCLEAPRGGVAAGGSFSCGDSDSGKHRAGAILAGIGAAGVISGLGLTIWGASRKTQGTDVRVGLGQVSATYRF